MIQFKEFGWVWCKHTWSKDGRKHTVFKLAKHLQMIIKRGKQYEIPNEPPINMPQRMNLPVLGTLTSNVASLDEKYNENESEVKAKAIQMHLE